jgi:hypothetical protein
MPDPGLLGREWRSDMRVELLHIAGCPHTEATRRLLNETLQELGLAGDIEEIEVSDSSQAEALRFPGSPTIRIDGIDVETAMLRQNRHGLSCRIYMIDGNAHGAPTQEMIRRAIQAASPPDTQTRGERLI